MALETLADVQSRTIRQIFVKELDEPHKDSHGYNCYLINTEKSAFDFTGNFIRI